MNVLFCTDRFPLRYSRQSTISGLLTLTHPPPKQNGRHLADNIFSCICLNENYRIPIQISLKHVPMSPIDNGSGDGLAPNRRQAITWTNDNPVH